MVIDGSEALTDEDHKLLEMTKNKNRIVVYNKNDKAIQHDGISISAINGDVEALTNAINAWTSLKEITGKAGKEDLLDEIFSRFCLGK